MDSMIFETERTDPNIDAHYAFPATATYVRVLSTSGVVLFLVIQNAGAPGTSFTNAEIGSIYINGTNGTLLTKRDTADTWTAP